MRSLDRFLLSRREDECMICEEGTFNIELEFRTKLRSRGRIRTYWSRSIETKTFCTTQAVHFGPCNNYTVQVLHVSD